MLPALRTAGGLGTASVVDTGTGAANVPTITQADARYQPLDSDLTAIAALATTSFGRALLALADAAALRRQADSLLARMWQLSPRLHLPAHRLYRLPPWARLLHR
jgi:hypothetical protein